VSLIDERRPALIKNESQKDPLTSRTFHSAGDPHERDLRT